LELLPKRKSSLAPFAVASIGLAAAGAAVWFANNQVGKPLPNSGADIGVHAATNGSKPSPSDYTQEPGPSGVNIDSIPLAPEEIAAAKARGAHPAKPGEAAAPPTEKPKAEKPEKTSDPKAPVEPEKELTPQKEPTEPPPTEPELPPAPTEKPPPPDQRTPLNRSSALTALSKAATSAASCKREGGPSGTGSASITFSPDGPVSSVSISAPFAGTPVGACVQTIFRSAHVPPFSGSAVTLSKSFRIPD
jgi:outer membrane biosynthesis protein TonB